MNDETKIEKPAYVLPSYVKPNAFQDYANNNEQLKHYVERHPVAVEGVLHATGLDDPSAPPRLDYVPHQFDPAHQFDPNRELPEPPAVPELPQGELQHNS